VVYSTHRHRPVDPVDPGAHRLAHPIALPVVALAPLADGGLLREVTLHVHPAGAAATIRRVTVNPLGTAAKPDVYGNFDIFFSLWDQFWRISQLHPDPTRAVDRGLLGAQADLMPTGACNPMLCPIWGFNHA